MMAYGKHVSHSRTPRTFDADVVCVHTGDDRVVGDESQDVLGELVFPRVALPFDVEVLQDVVQRP